MSAIVPVLDHPEEVRRFVEHGLWQGRETFGAGTAIGFANAKEGLIAGFVYHNYAPDQGVIELSGYSTRRNWASRDAVSLIFGRYPFLHLGCRLLMARHSETNNCVRRIWAALGADETLIPDIVADGVAQAIAVLKRDVFLTSKFMEPKYGKT